MHQLNHSPKQHATKCYEKADKDGGRGGAGRLLGLLQHDPHLGDGGGTNVI